ncbi:unnamed protein product [Discosporangium mesarthrocarpum]
MAFLHRHAHSFCSIFPLQPTKVADADVITTLTALGIIERAGEDKKASFMASHTPELRAVAVQVCHRMAEILGDKHRPHDLSLYLRRLGRTKEYADAPRFVPHKSLAL